MRISQAFSRLRTAAPAFALLFCLVATPPAKAVSTHGGHLIQISVCDPRQNYGQPGGYVYGPGWVPAYYPVRPYYYNPGYYNHVYYQPPMTPSAELGIDYKNLTPKTMKTIDFGLIANGRLVAIVRDVGTFTQGAEIKHKFGISPNVFPISTGLPVCAPLHIVYADGTTWTNPNLPPDNPNMYRAHP
jgi:hypothetical protein